MSRQQEDEVLLVARRRSVFAMCLVAATAALFGGGMLAVSREHSPLPGIARFALTTALPKWHTTEPVNEIVYGSRGFDTFGETFLLLAAVVSITTLTRARERRREQAGEARAGSREQQEVDPASGSSPQEAEARQAEAEETEDDPNVADTPDARALGGQQPERAESMTVVVRVAARVVAVPLTVAAVYLCAWGYSPGGGFPAGAALAGVLLLLYAAFGMPRMRRVLSPELLEPLELLGALAIIAVEVLGLVLRGSVSANWLPLGPPQTIRSGGVLQAFSVSELLEVSTGILLAVVGLLKMRHDWSPDEEQAGQAGEEQAGERQASTDAKSSPGR